MPDFAIALSNHYRWDAASTVVDPATGRRASVQAAYPDSATDFKPMVDTAQKALQFASTVYPGVPYPYPKTTIVLGSADEEYPMMVNDGSNLGSPFAATLPENAFTGFVAAHELLHSWFPFYMGINEKRYPFMDEGWTTAFEYLRNREVLGVPTADGLFKDFRSAVAGHCRLSSYDLPIITPHDALFGQSPVFGFNQYGKAALGYLALKDLMGDAAFRTALHTFMARWNGKRPLPWDMFNSFNDAGVGNYDLVLPQLVLQLQPHGPGPGRRAQRGRRADRGRAQPGRHGDPLRPGADLCRRQQRARAPHAGRLAGGRSQDRGAASRAARR